MMNTKGATILISGGSGSWGRELSTQLLETDVKKIIIYSRGEISQVAMKRLFKDERIDYVIGDVRDTHAVDKLFAQNKIDYVFQLAALKHVPICENQPWEAVLTNICGTKNLIDASVNYKVKKFIFVSTDKAVDPLNVYGLTKAIAEKLIIQANCISQDTDFLCIRSGNVIGTNGSLVPYVISQIAANNKVLITDKTMTRFFTTFHSAVKFLIFAMETGVGGEILVYRMPSFYITDAVDVLVKSYGNKDTEIVTIGLREGEKIHEVLISEHEIPRIVETDNSYIIRPQLDTGRKYKELKKAQLHRFSSADNLQDINVLKELFIESGYLK